MSRHQRICAFCGSPTVDYKVSSIRIRCYSCEELMKAGSHRPRHTEEKDRPQTPYREWMRDDA